MCRTIGYQHFIQGLNSIENVTEYVPTLVITFNVTYHSIVKAGKSAVKRTVCLNIWVDNVVAYCRVSICQSVCSLFDS